MREIEVKAKVHDIDKLLALAETLGIQFGPPVEQHDTTYETTLSSEDPEWNIFRLRKQDGKTILTMKYRASRQSRDNYEHETIVDNEAETIKILQRLGFVRGIDINKVRRTAKLNDIEFCLDKVEHLGTFIELEKLTDEQADAHEVQQTLWELLASLGTRPEDRIYDGYDVLIHQLLSDAPR